MPPVFPSIGPASQTRRADTKRDETGPLSPDAVTSVTSSAAGPDFVTTSDKNRSQTQRRAPAVGRGPAVEDEGAERYTAPVKTA